MEQKPDEKFVVRYKKQSFDLTNFVQKHPGGINTLSNFRNADIDFKFEESMPHSKAARYLLNEYKVSTPINNNYLRDDRYRSHLNSNGNAFNIKYLETDNQSEQDNMSKQFVNTSIGSEYKKNDQDYFIRIDESMEHLVDWSRGMVAQIGQLGDNYTEWVNKPVDRPLRLFDRDYLEILTKTPWWIVPSVWIPIIIFIAKYGIDEAHNNGCSNSFILFRAVFGIFFWTLIEYSLHRWVFHLDSTNKNQIVCIFHFLLHGLHHKVPFDPYRLVFPPFPAFILANIIYHPLALLFDYPKLVLVGGLMGYITYDMIHYYIHYGSPSGGHLYYMKRYHYQHHFVHHDKGFGISSSIWDEAFDTKIILRKLKYLLKW